MSTKDTIKLPFGWELSRTVRPSAIPPPVRRQRQVAPASNDAKVPTKSGAPGGKSNRYTNALSGAPDTGRRDASRLDFGAISAGRKSLSDPNSWSEFSVWANYTKRRRNAEFALAPEFDIDTFANMDFDELAELLAELSPEVSKAAWDFVVLGNSGYTLKAYRPGTEDIDERAQAVLDDVSKTLGNYHGTLGIFFDKLFKMIFLRGSFLVELVLADNRRDFIDVAIPDTRTLEYRRRVDPLRGQVWTFGQLQFGQYVDLDLPTIRYLPVHPMPDSIEGQPICGSAFFLAIFLMAVLRDTKRVVQHQGYMRLDVAVLFDKLRDTMPEEAQGNPDAVVQWMSSVIDSVQSVYSSLEPDDTYVHSDSIEVRNPVGTVNADALGAIDALFNALERMSVRALKTMPLLMGTEQSRTETQANREWEIYAKGIETCQHWIEAAMEYVFTLALRAQGIQAEVCLRFEQFRTAEKMRDIQVDLLKAQHARYLYDSGYISQDEAAELAIGRKEADAPEPRTSSEPAGEAAPPPADANLDENPNPGEERIARSPTAPQLDDAERWWREFASEASEGLWDAELATTEEQAATEVPTLQ